MMIDANQTLDLLARLPKASGALASLRAALQGPAPEGMNQFGRHGRAWAATYLETLAQMSAYADEMNRAQRLGELEQNLTLIIFGEYLNQLAGGLPMSQGEIVRPADLGFADGLPGFEDADVVHLRAHANTAQRRAGVAQLMLDSGQAEADAGLDETHMMIRNQFRRFADEKVIPHAHGWHLRDELIPLPLIEELGQLGVFGLTVPEEFGGMGLGKQAMCVVSEELSRGYIGVGSLGTRTDIAAELILQNGTQAQKQNYLPRIANGSMLPTAVFTEPNTGSDLASLSTRAKKTETGY